MSDEVLVRYGENRADTATLLLGAADELEMEAFVVRHQPEDGGFRVPEEVAKKAGLKSADEEKEAQVAEEERRAHLDAMDSEQGMDPQTDDAPKASRSSRSRSTSKSASKSTASKSTSKAK